MKFGIDVLLQNKMLLKALSQKKVSLVAHPASVTKYLTHSLHALKTAGVPLVCGFGPQHGMQGEKQDNMMESEDYLDIDLKIPVFSLYGKSRRPTKSAMEMFDICLFDLQDVGTRIYTFLTTLLYMMEACAEYGKELWILDRPNPAGRPVEGSLLKKSWESFVGAGPFPMRHGMTLGEMSLLMKSHFKLNLELKVISMEEYNINSSPGFGWPANTSWVNPSPNAATVAMARCFPGTVLIEGTTLSEGRGTTHPLELMGAPDINVNKILNRMSVLAPEWLRGCTLRPCYFEPTFQKHSKKLCQGFQIHVDHSMYQHEYFKPYRLVSLFLKSLRMEHPSYEIWRNFAYEYEYDRLAIDLINGSDFLRTWVDDTNSSCVDFEKYCSPDEKAWTEVRRDFLLY